MNPVLTAACALLAPTLAAQTIQPPFSSHYSYVDLGTPAGIDTHLGGVAFKVGDPDALYVGGGAAVYRVPITRDAAGHLTGFAGPAVKFADAPNIDGGLQFGPGGVLFFTRYRINELGQIAPGSTTMTKSVPLSPLGVLASVGGLSFIPAGHPRAGDLLLASYNASTVYTATLTPDGSGTYDVSSVTPGPRLGNGGPEGVLYVPPGSPQFTDFEHLLVCEWRTGQIEVFHLDANGDPEPASLQVFMTGLTGCAGAAIDPIGGDFVFGTWGGGDRVLAIEGFSTPCGRSSNYGEATAGSGGLAPTLTTEGCLARGQTVQLMVGDGLGAARGVMLVGVRPQDVPLFGIAILVDPFTTIVHALGGTPDVPGEGTLVLNLKIPDDPGLLGAGFYLQSIYLDPGGPQGLSASDGLQFNVR